MSSVVTNPRAIFRERVEVRGTVFDDEGDRAQKNQIYGGPAEKLRGNRLKGAWFASG